MKSDRYMVVKVTISLDSPPLLFALETARLRRYVNLPGRYRLGLGIVEADQAIKIRGGLMSAKQPGAPRFARKEHGGPILTSVRFQANVLSVPEPLPPSAHSTFMIVLEIARSPVLIFHSEMPLALAN
ncbi:hypothetical protein CLCR_03189 [Cladophialophora carrionii]|uniref:Uncharacterized protein n=1 Tax=Cladophialophora carrionii TaxID=86049 RepID=A0A1C1D1W5_9EURO|nr:hypothetical protein CLCR_03189 [Cladophialophora carrionii]